MIKKDKKLVITFYTSAEAMATEKACKENGVVGKLISAPRELTADCGISYCLGLEDKEKVTKLLNDKKIEYESIVEILI